MASDTAPDRTTALYNKVLGGRFIPGDNQADPQQNIVTPQSSGFEADATAEDDQDEGSLIADETVPELKTVIQFHDSNGKHVIEFEGYNFNAPETNNEEATNEEEEKDPFKEYPVLFKAVLSQSKTLRWRLEIQSEKIVDIFREIAKNYLELDLETSVLVIEHPFRCLFFLRGELEKRSKTLPLSRKTQVGLAQLLNFIKSPMCHQGSIDTYENQVVKGGKISFFTLWMLFPPFEPIVRVRRGQSIEDSQCFILESMTDTFYDNTPRWKLKLLFGCHDGGDFEIKSKEKFIDYFDGFRQIDHHSMKFVPLRFLEQKSQTSIRDSLIARGRAYLDVCKKDFSLWNYSGPAYLPTSGNTGNMRIIRSRKVLQLNEDVIIDCEKQGIIGEIQANRGDVVANCISKVLPTMKRVEAAPSEPIVKPSQSTPLPSFIPEGWTQTGGDWAELDPADYSKPKPPSLVDEDYLICRNVVIAFALKQKIWVKMVLFSHLREIPYNEDPFESLQFSPQRKLFIRRLVEGFKSGKENSYDDVIDDKGKGLIFLLYGPPGLGKTLTAESVAKVAQRPLYHVSAGELGTDVGSLERELLKIFQMGARWNAVVLLDEADVLMSKRTTDSLQRNSVVAVFLRMLEYYSGMLFLTTNRRDDFDDAFFNRIHVTIEYSELDDMSRANIWRHHLARATQGNTRPSTWTEDMYQQLGRLQLNGRNIKNYVRTAHAFTTAANGEDLTLKQVLIVLRNSLPGSSVSGSIGSNRQSDGRELLLQKLEELVI